MQQHNSFETRLTDKLIAPRVRPCSSSSRSKEMGDLPAKVGQVSEDAADGRVQRVERVPWLVSVVTCRSHGHSSFIIVLQVP